MAHYTTIVIGASLGGVETLQEIVAGLPRDIPAAIFVVQHIGRFPSRLPSILSKAGVLPARHAKHLQLIERGHIYVAPPDHHLTVAQGHTALSRGPRENWARPAIDPLFRSAASVFDGSVVAVVLSGTLNDGSAGLRSVRQRRGKGVVQDPDDAAFPDMPASALRLAGADYCVPARQIPALLVQLSNDIITTQEETSHWRVAP